MQRLQSDPACQRGMSNPDAMVALAKCLHDPGALERYRGRGDLHAFLCAVLGK